jgi:hypothetical protein
LPKLVYAILANNKGASQARLLLVSKNPQKNSISKINIFNIQNLSFSWHIQKNNQLTQAKAHKNLYQKACEFWQKARIILTPFLNNPIIMTCSNLHKANRVHPFTGCS